MIIGAAALFLLLIYVLPVSIAKVVLPSWRYGGDPFSPLTLLTLLGLLNIPYMVLLAFDVDAVSIDVKYSPWVHDIPAAVAKSAFLIALGFLAQVMGLFSSLSVALAARMPVLGAPRLSLQRCRRAILLAGMVGLGVYLWYIQRIGGLRYLWSVLYLRAILQQGLAYYFYLYSILLTFACLLAVYLLRFRRTPTRYLFAVVAVLGVAFVLGSTGGRTPVVSLVLAALMVYHYAVRRLENIFTARNAVLGVVMLLFVVVMPLFRAGGATARYTADPSLLVDEVMLSLESTASGLSGLDRVLVTQSYFSVDKIWWGASYMDLLYAPIPRSIFPDKPPVDDGVYVKTIAEGWEVRPSRPARELSLTSWPMGNFMAFINFWYPGYLLTMFLSGAIIGAAYRYMQRSDYSADTIYIYNFVIRGGVSVSNYGIVHMVITITMVSLFFWGFFFTGAAKRLPAWATPSPGPLPLPARPGARP